MRRWSQRQHRARTLAVSLLILALLPTPWPKVECHNVRHHDDPGQVCEYHDHLLRWHPDATEAEDVAVLHWHWAWPDRAPAESGHDGTGPRLHAYLGDEALPTTDPGAAIVADSSVRPLAAPAAEPPRFAAGFTLAPSDSLDLRSGATPALPFEATFAPHASLTCRLHRWSC